MWTRPTRANQFKSKRSLFEIRKPIGWIDAELSRLRGTESKRRTKKRAFLIAKLRRLFGRGKLDTKRLLALREKRVALLGVRALQCRRANDKMATVGPKSLKQKTPMQEVPPRKLYKEILQEDCKPDQTQALGGSRWRRNCRIGW